MVAVTAAAKVVAASVLKVRGTMSLITTYPVTDACVSTKKYMQGGVQYSRTRSPSGIWGVGHIKLETWERIFILL